MSRTYDTGLTSPQRTLIQNKIIELLQPLKLLTLGGTDAKGVCQAIVPLAFRVRAEDIDTISLLETKLGSKSPAIAVAVLDLDGEQAGGVGRATAELAVELYFLTSHRRDVTEGRATGDAISTADDTADPGIYALLELAWMYLFDSPLGIPTVHEMKLRHEREVITTERQTLWRQTWHVMVGRDKNMYRGLVQQLTRAVTTLNPTDDTPPSKNIIVDKTIP
jgi:hypothetical protein